MGRRLFIFASKLDSLERAGYDDNVRYSSGESGASGSRLALVFCLGRDP